MQYCPSVTGDVNISNDHCIGAVSLYRVGAVLKIAKYLLSIVIAGEIFDVRSVVVTPR